MAIHYKAAVRVTVEVTNCKAIDDNIQTLENVIKSKEWGAKDSQILADIMSILEGIKRNYHDGTRHPVCLSERKPRPCCARLATYPRLGRGEATRGDDMRSGAEAAEPAD